MPQAAERLQVSPARIRQRIADGSLPAEKIGGRWLVDLDASHSAPPPKGRPVSPSSVWWSLAAAEVAKAGPRRDGPAASLPARLRQAERLLAGAPSVVGDPDNPDQAATAADDLEVLVPGIAELAIKLSRSSRNRAAHRLVEAVVARDHPALLAWLANRGERRVFVVARQDQGALREDGRMALSGVSHSDSGLEDPRVVEAYVLDADLGSVVRDYWLERPDLSERPNVFLHVVPVKPSAMGPMLLAADLAEHRGPREALRAHELLEQAIDELIADVGQPQAPDGQASA